MIAELTPPNTLHVAHAVLSLDVGGLERIVLDLVREGYHLGQRVSILCLERPGRLASEAEALGVRVVCVHKRPGLRLGTFKQLRDVLDDLRPDVLHTHQVAALFYAGSAARSVGVPVVHTEHGNHFARAGWLRTQRMAWLWWWSARHARKFFCVSKDIANELGNRRVVPRHKLEVVCNGIDTEPFGQKSDTEGLRASLQIPGDALVIGTVGRLNEIKRQDLLLRAFARVRTQFPSAHLLIVGDGPVRDELQRLAESLALGDWVHFAGYQSQPERYLQAMDVFSLTSRMEGLPLSILEAWATGLPVVASAVGGVPDLIEHGRNGLLFPSGDESALVGLLGELLRDPLRRRSLGDAGKEEVSARYDLARMAGEYDRHYRELLGHYGRVDPCAS